MGLCVSLVAEPGQADGRRCFVLTTYGKDMRVGASPAHSSTEDLLEKASAGPQQDRKAIPTIVIPNFLVRHPHTNIK